MAETRWCGECGGQARFERVDCTDHGQECLELVCAGCGAGYELAALPPPARPAAPVSTAA